MTPWIALAKNAEIDESVETSLLEFIVRADESGDAKQLREANLRLNLSHIETFLKVGAAFADEVRSYLGDTNDGDTTEQGETDDIGGTGVESEASREDE